ncbi:GTP cyclohydrolase [Helicobacter muridarum]|uniref:GTP cyclohydrolase n=1 Tax=Helicobacter muridarum TaxID=216 RepID=A0A099U168_9HELI|nr:YciI family protein [Helicobacter muridarum]TLE00748.1 GTP cyclohydrolase [Helicobacter muridarum]STQ86573.1 YCII-related protein [Helicobacter muridarum]
MKLFVCIVNYIKPLDKVEEVLPLHRAYLQECYNKGFLLASGPKNPRDGGLIIGKFKDKQEAILFSKNDPFCQKDIAEYDIIEFDAVLHSSHLNAFLS